MYGAPIHACTVAFLRGGCHDRENERVRGDVGTADRAKYMQHHARQCDGNAVPARHCAAG